MFLAGLLFGMFLKRLAGARLPSIGADSLAHGARVQVANLVPTSFHQSSVHDFTFVDSSN